MMSIAEPKAAFGQVPCQVAKVPQAEMSCIARRVQSMKTASV